MTVPKLEGSGLHGHPEFACSHAKIARKPEAFFKVVKCTYLESVLKNDAQLCPWAKNKPLDVK